MAIVTAELSAGKDWTTFYSFDDTTNLVQSLSVVNNSAGTVVFVAASVTIEMRLSPVAAGTSSTFDLSTLALGMVATAKGQSGAAGIAFPDVIVTRWLS